jgi:hypothetical protein
MAAARELARYKLDLVGVQEVRWDNGCETWSLTLREERRLRVFLHEVGGGRRDWLALAQDRDRWRALVGTVRDFRVP